MSSPSKPCCLTPIRVRTGSCPFARYSHAVTGRSSRIGPMPITKIGRASTNCADQQLRISQYDIALYGAGTNLGSSIFRTFIGNSLTWEGGALGLLLPAGVRVDLPPRARALPRLQT